MVSRVIPCKGGSQPAVLRSLGLQVGVYGFVANGASWGFTLLRNPPPMPKALTLSSEPNNEVFVTPGQLIRAGLYS